MITTTILSEAIENAKNIDACEDHIKIIENFNNWDEFLNHEKAPYWLYWYAKNVINDRWIDAEEYIIKDSEWAYSYARYVIKDRWYDAEEYIMKVPYWAYSYTRYVIKGR